MSDFLRGNDLEYMYGKIIAVQPSSKASSKHVGIRPNVLLNKVFQASWGSWSYSRLIGEEPCTGSYTIEGYLKDGRYFKLTEATIELVAEKMFK